MMDMSYSPTTITTRNLHFVMSIVLPYLVRRGGTLSHDGYINKLCDRLQQLCRLVDLVHRIAFIRFGGYRTAVERVLHLRLMHNSQPMLGE